jgi:glycosyltransferase involved in cell wall biosynthesis
MPTLGSGQQSGLNEPVMIEITRKVIVVTPVRNEEWIISCFLKATLEFADQVILLDHNSTDNTVEIAKTFERVEILKWPDGDFSELERRIFLLHAARMHGKENLIFSLDADEIPVFRSINSKVLHSMKQAESGNHFKFTFANVLPGFTHYWEANSDPMAFIDDGSAFDHDHKIHFPRLPRNVQSTVSEIPEVTIMHMQYLNWSRMQSKHRWYQMWERISFPEKPAIEIYRRYHHMDAIRKERVSRIPKGWEDLNFVGDGALRSLGLGSSSFWWDDECKRMAKEHSADKFRFLKLDEGQASQGPFSLERVFFDYADKTERFMSLPLWHPIRLMIRLMDKSFMRFFK